MLILQRKEKTLNCIQIRFSEALLCCRKHGNVCKLLTLRNKLIPVKNTRIEQQKKTKTEYQRKAETKISKSSKKKKKGDVQVSFE